MKSSFVTCSVFFILFLNQALGLTCYVSVFGSDETGECTEANPVQSFGKAFSYGGISPLEIYVFPGVYGGPSNSAISYQGSLRIVWFQNQTTSGSNLVQFNCSYANAGDTPCISSNTSISISGFDNSRNAQIIFQKCFTCISVENAADPSQDYFLEVEGVTFTSMSHTAIYAYRIYTVSIQQCTFTENVVVGALDSLVVLVDINTDVWIQYSNFTALHRNGLSIVNATSTRILDCSFDNANLAITGVEESYVLIHSTVISSSSVAIASYIAALSMGTITISGLQLNVAGIGGLKILNANSTSIMGSSFSTAVASNGGALYFENVPNIEVVGSLFYANTATLYGGAIYLVNSEIMLYSTNFTSNAASDGAAIGCKKSDVYYDSSTVFNKNVDTGLHATDIQTTCKVQTLTHPKTVW